MKRCPTCQKTFSDSMKFCQTDGTPLVEDQNDAPQSDPYKTVVGSISDDDLLQIPDNFDPMKTMVTSDVPKAEDKPKDSSSEGSSKSEASTVVSPSKPLDSAPGASPFGDSSSKSTGADSVEINKPKNFDATFSAIDPPAFGTPKKGDTAPFGKPSDTPFGSPVKDNLPFGSPLKDESPFGSSSKDDAPPTAFGGTPFDQPKPSSVPPPYKEPVGSSSPFGSQSNDPWGSPQTPFGNQSNEPFGSPQFGGGAQGEWSPPPAPVSDWQNQGVGANTPFQPPMGGTGGQDQTLAIVSLVCGVLGLCCGIFGIAALITGYMAKNNADTNPAQYGGRGLALAGMILGGVSIVFTIIGILVQVLGLLR